MLVVLVRLLLATWEAHAVRSLLIRQLLVALYLWQSLRCGKDMP